MLMNLSEVFTSEGSVLKEQFSMNGQSVEIAGEEHRAVKEYAPDSTLPE